MRFDSSIERDTEACDIADQLPSASIKMKNFTELKLNLLLFDLYWLRFKKQGDQWYELTDYLRDKLREDGIEISYTKDSLMYSGYIEGKYISGNIIRRQSGVT